MVLTGGNYQDAAMAACPELLLPVRWRAAVGPRHG
jgi:hypothetical protein